MSLKKRYAMLLKNFITAKESSVGNIFDIVRINEDNYEEYYILLKPNNGNYRDQWQILYLNCKEYPFKTPKLIFKTEIYHSNVYNGNFCLDILNNINQWLPTYSFEQIIMSVVLLYQQPGHPSRLYKKCEHNYKNYTNEEMSIEELEELENKYFDPFKKYADNIWKKSSLSKFVEYFPQIANGEPRQDQLLEAKAMLKNLLPKAVIKKSQLKKKSWAKFKK